MHWSKRGVFLITLVAFLSNLAFGMAVPNVQESTHSKGKPGFECLQKSHAELTFSAFETLEELEELEQETDLDSDAASKVVYRQNLSSIFADCYFQKCPEQGALYEQDAFRTWLWLKQAIYTHFQVFRI